MKKKFSSIGILLATCSLIIAMQNAKPLKIVFFGDSITELGVQPGGYIAKLRQMLKEKHVSNYQLIGAGVSGNKVYDLFLRLDDDVLSQKPEWVFIYVGVNDVWHKKLLGTGTDPDKFEKFYAAIIRKLQGNGIQVALCTPAVIGEKAEGKNELDNDLNKFSQIVRNLAAKHDLPLCDLRQIFMKHLAQYNQENKEKSILTTDGVHLNDAGNQLVATHMLKIILP